MAKPIRKSDFAGVGCALQALGLLMPFILGALLGPFGPAGFVIGIVAGLVLLLVGSRKSIKWVCSACGNRLEGRKVKICPVCHSKLDTPPP